MEIEESLRQIERCRCPSGLYRAVPADSGVIVPVYRDVWIRGTVYTLLAFEAVGDIDRLRDGPSPPTRLRQCSPPPAPCP